MNSIHSAPFQLLELHPTLPGPASIPETYLNEKIAPAPSFLRTTSRLTTSPGLPFKKLFLDGERNSLKLSVLSMKFCDRLSGAAAAAAAAAADAEDAAVAERRQKMVETMTMKGAKAFISEIPVTKIFTTS